MNKWIGSRQKRELEDKIGDRKSYLDIVRIFACFMVIINHTMGLVDQYGNMSIYKWLASVLTFGICKTGVTLFLFLTGILLLEKQESYLKWIRRIIHIVVIAYVWSVIYGEFWNIYFSGRISFTIFWDCMLTFMHKEGSWHLWYLYALMGLYVMLPMLRKIAVNMGKSDWNVFLGLWFVFGMAVPFCNIIFPDMVHFHYYFSVPLFWGFIPLLFVGNYIDDKLIKGSGIIVSVVVLLVAITINMYFTYNRTSMEGSFSRIFDDATCFPVVLEAMSLFYLIKCWGGNIKNATIKHILKEISECTFGIYLLHPICLNLIYKTNIYTAISEKYSMSLLFLLGLQILTFVACLMVCYVIRKIPIINRVIL